MVLGRFGFAAFCLTLTLGLDHQPAPLVFIEASVIAMLVQTASARLARLKGTQSATRANLSPETATPE
jgi:hypothetical protein